MAIVPTVARAGLGAQTPHFATDPIWQTATLLAFAVGLGWTLEKRGVASGPLYAGIAVSALAHGTGWAPGRLAPDIQVAAQTLVGAWIGARFIGFDWRLLHRTLIDAITSFLAAFAVAAAFAFVTTKVVDVRFAEALAAFAPGGLEAMTMMAFALGLDPLFVGAHHLARFFMISLALPFVARKMGGARAAPQP
jgi:membrane AbrB-like protein